MKVVDLGARRLRLAAKCEKAAFEFVDLIGVRHRLKRGRFIKRPERGLDILHRVLEIENIGVLLASFRPVEAR